MNKLTMRDYWAFWSGFSVSGALIGYTLHAPTVFLLNAVMLVIDAFMFYREVTK